MENKKLEIGKCKGCRTYFEKNKLQQFIFLVPYGDGILKRIDWLCQNCMNQLKHGLKHITKSKKEDL